MRRTNVENEHFAKILQRKTVEILGNNSVKIDGVFATCIIYGVFETCVKFKNCGLRSNIFDIYFRICGIQCDGRICPNMYQNGKGGTLQNGDLNASERLSLSLHNFPHVDKNHLLGFFGKQMI